MGGRNLTHVNSLNILGVVFDSKLTFTAHAEYLKSKITQITQALGMFSEPTGHQRPTIHRHLHQRNVTSNYLRRPRVVEKHKQLALGQKTTVRAKNATFENH